MCYEIVKCYKDKKFKRKVGVPRLLFEMLVEAIKQALLKKHEKGGRNPKLSFENMLLIFFTYYRDYPTYLSLSTQFVLDESNIWRWVKWVEDVLINVIHINDKDMKFGTLINISSSNNKVDKLCIVDVTECTIQRSKKIEVQKEYYSIKKEKTYA